MNQHRTTLCVLLVAMVCSSANAQPAPPIEQTFNSRSFVVVDEEGKPIPDATATIVIASELNYQFARQNVFSHLRRRVIHADAHGRIVADGLPNLYQLNMGVSAPGFANSRINFYGSRQNPDKAALKAASSHPTGAINGRLIDADHAPVQGAVVIVTSTKMVPTISASGQESFGSVASGWDGDLSAMTDKDGRFSLVTDPRGVKFDIEIAKPGLCRARFIDLHTGPDERELTMPVPARVKGRVLREGDLSPQPGIVVTLSAPHPGSDGESSPVHATTGPDGTFEFPLVPPGQAMIMATPIEPSRESSFATINIPALEPGSATTLPDITLLPTVQLSGNVRFDGLETPLPCTVTVSAYDNFNWAETRTNEKGAFTLTGLAKGAYYIYVQTEEKEWQVSASNRSIAFESAKFLLGNLSRSKTGLQILMDKGGPEGKPAARVEDQPLRGIERREAR